MLRVNLNDKRYMCSAAFWQDKHNIKMASLIEDLMFQRDLLSTISQESPKDFFQRTDGFVKEKPKSGFFKFLKGPNRFEKEFAESMNEKYALIKSDIHRLSKNAKSEIKRDI